MNYIKQLQTENSELKESLTTINEIVLELYCYLYSYKFSCGDELDGYVNRDDIINRIEMIKRISLMGGK